jgi:hypothetical protein
LWRASLHPGTVILVPAHDIEDCVRLEDLLAWRDKLVDISIDRGRYLALGNATHVHRVFIRDDSALGPLAAVAAMDRHLPQRLHAAQQLRASLAGAGEGKQPHGTPTPYHADRLSRMLRILDALDYTRPGTVASREVSESIVYPSTRFASAVEWKVSSERRHTLRLIKEAIAMREGGYVRLLTSSR